MNPLPKKIAVIAVHGVGDQQPYESAHKIADLLQSLDAANRSADPASPESPGYYPFHEDKLRLDVRPTVVQNPDSKDRNSCRSRKSTLGPFNAWLDSLQRNETVDDEDLWYQFTRGQLQCYRGEEPQNAYETVRLEGRRAPRKSSDGNEEASRDVHIYELYWADLSRLKAGALSIFTELYQLLFHLGSLGTHAVNAAAAHHRDDHLWRVYRWLQGAAAVILALPILVVNLLMLGVTAVVLGTTAVSSRACPTERAILAAVGGVLLTGLLGWGLWRALASFRPKAWFWILPLGIGAAAALWSFFALQGFELHFPLITSILLAVIAALLLRWVLQKYDRRRPGSLRWGTYISLALLLAAGITACTKLPHDSPTTTAALTLCDKTGIPLQQSHVIAFWVREFEVADIALAGTWAAFFVISFLAVLIGSVAASRSDRASGKGTVGRRTWWTGLLMLTLPALLFLITTSTTWLLIAETIWKGLPSTMYRPLLARGSLAVLCTVESLGETIKNDLHGIVGILLPFAVLALVPAIWSMAPVVWPEIFPPRAPRPPAHPKELERFVNTSTRLGRWLTLAFAGLKVSGWVLYFGTMVFLPVAAILYVFGVGTFLKSLPGHDWFTAFSAIGLTAFLLLRGKAKKILLGFRSVLDMLLDVDNWLREHPRDSNPKSRICGRYVSLLRYIANWKDRPELVNGAFERRGYDVIVIIAHSQGTVITADLLKFLQREGGADTSRLADYDEQLAPIANIPIYLFTMGCPLRQLYGLRFPHLYHWARHESTEQMSEWGKGDLRGSPEPDPRKLLQVQLWENCYRSGDYIGRFLWRTDACKYIWEPDACGHPVDNPQKSSSTDGLWRSEFCIGPGAHTHYWDATAYVVAKELDRLIAAV